MAAQNSSPIKRMSMKERWQRTSIFFRLKSPPKGSETIDRNSLKLLLNALLDENEEKAISIYTAVDGSGRSLELDMHPSLPIGENEETPLHLAAAARAVSLVKVFIEHGGSPNTTNGSNQTCLHASCGGIQKNRGSTYGSLFKDVIGLWDQVVTGRSSAGSDIDENRKHWLQAQCLEFLLNWRGLEIDGDSEKPLVNAVDDQGNTALHYAASHGLVSCCHSLINHGAILTVVNGRQETACELAGACEYVDLADALEALVIFNESLAEEEQSNQRQRNVTENECTFKSLSAQDLNALAVNRSVEAGAYLRVSENWSVHLLIACGWNIIELQDRAREGIEALLEEAKLSPESWERALKVYGQNKIPEWVEVGGSVLVNIGGEEENGGDTQENSMHATVLDIAESSVSVQLDGEDWEMEVAFENIKENTEGVCAVCGETLPLIKNGCGHRFCEDCWAGYLGVQLREGSGAVPVCAAPSCALQVSSEVATTAFKDQPDLLDRWERVLSAAIAARAYDICPCPAPGCDRAILRSERAGDDINAICSEGHTFCWECKVSDVHGPASCEQWAAWSGLVKEHLQVLRESGIMGEDTDENSQDIGNMIWLAANTKKCPKCSTPTEKIDGCNHMTCKQCRHEYCWICFKDWSLHSNKTGGYYRCNRFNEESEVNTNNSGEGSASYDHKQRVAQAVKAERFIHYYTRYAAQQSSRMMEQAKKEDTLSRIKLLQRRLSSPDLQASRNNTENRRTTNDGNGGSGGGGCGGGDDESEDSAWRLTRDLKVNSDMKSLLALSFAELNHCRIVLRNSYSFAHLSLSNDEYDKRSLKERNRHRRRALRSELRESALRCEAAQSELESITETLSEILARRYMRASYRQIRAVTAAAQSCRLDLIRLCHAHANFKLFEPPPMTSQRRGGGAEQWQNHPYSPTSRLLASEDQEEQGVLSALMWGNTDLKEQELLSRVIMDSLKLDHTMPSANEDIFRQNPNMELLSDPTRRQPDRREQRSAVDREAPQLPDHHLPPWQRSQPPPSQSFSSGWREPFLQYNQTDHPLSDDWERDMQSYRMSRPPMSQPQQRYHRHPRYDPNLDRQAHFMPDPPLQQRTGSSYQQSRSIEDLVPPPVSSSNQQPQTSPVTPLSRKSPTTTTHRMAVVPLRPSPKADSPEERNSPIWLCSHCSWANSPWEPMCSSCGEPPDEEA